MRTKIVLSVTDQALISGFNFTLNLYLIKIWSPGEFGVFSIVSAIAILATMIQNALINTPLAVHMPVTASAHEKAKLRRVFTTSNTILSTLLLLSCAGGLWAGLPVSQFDLVIGASLFITSQFVREYYRSLLAVEGRLAPLLTIDLVYVLLSALTLAVLHSKADESFRTAPIIMFVLSGWGMASVGLYIFPRALPSWRDISVEVRAVFTSQRHEIGWSLLGVITTDIQNRGYLFVAAAFFGPATVAHLQAGRIFFGPLNLLTGAWSRVARPHMAYDLSTGKTIHFKKSMRRALAAFAAFNAIFLVCLFVAWPHLSASVFGTKYKDLGYIVAWWGLANLVFQIRSCLSIGAQALRRFRELTLSTIFGALGSACLVALACAADKPSWLIASVIIGECVAVTMIFFIFKNHLPKEATTQRSD